MPGNPSRRDLDIPLIESCNRLTLNRISSDVTVPSVNTAGYPFEAGTIIRRNTGILRRDYNIDDARLL